MKDHKNMSSKHKAKYEMLKKMKKSAVSSFPEDDYSSPDKPHDDDSTSAILMIAKKKGELRDISEDEMEKKAGPRDLVDYLSDMSTDEEYDEGQGSPDDHNSKLEKLKKRLKELS